MKHINIWIVTELSGFGHWEIVKAFKTKADAEKYIKEHIDGYDDIYACEKTWLMEEGET